MVWMPAEALHCYHVQVQVQGLGFFRVVSLSILRLAVGSYTVLRWRRVALPVLIQRLLITAMVNLIVVAIVCSLAKPAEEAKLVHHGPDCLA